MLYALLCYGHRDWITRDRAGRARIMRAHGDALSAANAAGALVSSVRLLPTESATTARSTPEGIAVLDGPFAETKDQLGGFQILDCENLDEALRYAKQYVGAGGTVEIRPLHPDPDSLE